MVEPTNPAPVSHERTATGDNLDYQPISLLAIVSFGIALVYAIVVLVGFVFSLILDSSWLMPVWTILIPFAGLVLSVIARVRVQRSEGTLAGLKLTGWGISLSLIFGLIYVAHTAAVYFVLRQQADAIAREWFEKLRDGNEAGAFRLTLRPSLRPMEGESLRSDIEARFNSPGERGPLGLFTEFQQNEVVRFLTNAGSDQLSFKLVSVLDWGYEQDGYQVLLLYRVKTQDVIVELILPVHSRKSQAKDSQNRQWQVEMDKIVVRDIKRTAEGDRLLELHNQSLKFLDEWLGAIQSGRVETAYLDTRPPNERPTLLHAYIARTPPMSAAMIGNPALCGWTDGIGTLALQAAWWQVCLPEFERDAKGNFVTVAESFWPPKEKQAEIHQEVRQLFRKPVDDLGEAIPRNQPRRIGRWKIENNHLQVKHDLWIVKAGSKYQISASVILECDANALPTGPQSQWRVVGVELIRAREGPTGPPSQPKST